MAIAQAVAPVTPAADLFEQTAWLYAFLREHVFRDDTARIEAALWPDGATPASTVLLEVGCGPGVYSRALAARHAQLRAIGVDRSPTLLRRAEALAERAGLTNCWFERGDALALDWPDASMDVVVASRLFTVVDGAAALSEMFRVLRPGGRCFIAEPATLLDTVGPMALLRLAGLFAAPAAGADRQPDGAAPWPRCLKSPEFTALVQACPWASAAIVQEDGYHYAVCQKAPGAGR